MKKYAKIIGFIILTAIALLTGCDRNTQADNNTPYDSFPVVTDGGEFTEPPVESGYETAPETAAETLPAETESPIEEDPAGMRIAYPAVLVGKVGRDAFGWFLTLEEPICVEGGEEKFENVTRVGMPESAKDGIDKSVYLGSIITVEGTFELSTDGKKSVYIVPNTLKMGKCIEKNMALTKLPEAVSSLGEYDEVTPLPEEMQIKLMDGKYAYNPYLLSREALEYCGNGFAEFYVDFIDAYLNYERFCSCPDKRYASILSTVLFYECPIFEADGMYEYLSDYDREEGIITLRYKSDKDEHDRRLSDFTSKINVFLSEADPAASDLERARAAYHALCTRVKYDYDALAKLNKNNAFHAYDSHSGVCITFSNAYVQLLTQIGIRNQIVPGQMVNGEAHVWTLATIDGKNYFFDPTFETSRNNGNGYLFFGMNYIDRTKDGTGYKGMSIGRYVPKDYKDVGIAEYSIK